MSGLRTIIPTTVRILLTIGSGALGASAVLLLVHSSTPATPPCASAAPSGDTSTARSVRQPGAPCWETTVSCNIRRLWAGYHGIAASER